MNRLRALYKDEIAANLKKDLGLKNTMEVPRLIKVTVNAGIGDIRENREALESFASDIGLITGQKPNPRKARKSESGFKIRQGETVGYAVTLRGEKMWTFLDKFINVVLPRVRDFKGLNPNSFDGNGNYSVGIREHIIFPEVNPNKIKGIRSLQVNFSIDSQSKEHSLALLEKLGMPFNKTKEN